MKANRISVLILLLICFQVSAQWSNRYPKIESYSHHIYLEAFELPILTSGPMDAAPSPVDESIAIASKGWLWLLDESTGIAKQITSSGGMDSRPEWSPNGKQLTFIRDDGSSTQLMLLDLETKKETVLINEDAINLDPVFSLDGKSVYYSSAINGMINLWEINLETNNKSQLSSSKHIQRRSIPIPNSNTLMYLEKQRSGSDAVKILDLSENTTSVLLEERIASQSDLSVSPDGYYLAYTWPDEGNYQLRVLDIATPNTSVLLADSNGMPLTPQFSADGQWVYFSEANDNERMTLKKISINGGDVMDIEVKDWQWKNPTGKLKISSYVDGKPDTVRMNILNSNGHALTPEQGTIRFDGQNGRVFFYCDGTTEIIAEAGEVSISAVHGLSTLEVTTKATIIPNTTTETSINLERLWNPAEDGWYAADNHFHLNYGGVYRLEPEDIIPDLKGENISIATPLLANLHNRFLEQNLWSWEQNETPIIVFGQEVRSHFLGHIGLIGTKNLFWPWVWGPYYQVYSRDDRSNSEALRVTRGQGGLGGYVHPTSSQDPLKIGNEHKIPINFIADAVLGEVDYLEVACLWSDEIGTEALWHSILNLGIPLAASGGSDVMNDYYRTMAIGSARVFVKPDGELNFKSYLEGLKKGKSFVTNGPLLEFKVDNMEAGDVVKGDSKKVKWHLNVHSATAFNNVEVFVNGKVVWSKSDNFEKGNHEFNGKIEVPSGGWVTAKVYGDKTVWPAMDSYIYAESSPIWFGAVGSTDPEAAKASAKILLRILEVNKQELLEGYKENPIPNLLGHFEEARKKLETIIGF